MSLVQRRLTVLLVAISASFAMASPASLAFAQDAPLSHTGSEDSTASAQTSDEGQYSSSEVPFDARKSTIGTGKEHDNFIAPFFETLVQPRLAPVGSNDWECQPSAEHPNPVVLIHGTFENAYDNWAAMAPALKRDGYCVFAPNVGRVGFLAQGGVTPLVPNTNGLGQVQRSAEQIGKFVDEVLEATGASQVDLVGHSQGGIMARYYAQFLGGTDTADPSQNRVGKIIGLGAPNGGTTLSGWGDLGADGVDVEGSLADENGETIGSTSGSLEDPLNWVNDLAGISETQRVELKKWIFGWAVAQQVTGSDLMAKLDEEGETRPGVDYTIIATEFDNLATPYERTFLTAGPGATVRNVTLQDGCAQDKSSHVSMPYSVRAIDYVRNALDPLTVPDSAIRCEPHAGALGFSVRSLV